MLTRRASFALPLLAFLPAAAFAGERAPRLKIGSVDRLPRPLPAPYDGNRNARPLVAAARERARKRRKPLLIDFGANWCADCRVLAGVLELPDVKGWIARNFELIQVDVGKFDANLEIPAMFGMAELSAIPAVLIVDPKSGRIRNTGEEIALGDARIMTPQSIVDWLAKWTI